MHIIDDIDAHLGAAGSIDRAALVPGMYFAWCVNLQLLAPQFEAAHERDALRLRYRELTPAAFFLKATGGRISDDMLTERGSRFAAHHYVVYREAAVLALYGAKDDWGTYDSISPALTKAYYTLADGGHTVSKTGRHWWQGWR